MTAIAGVWLSDREAAPLEQGRKAADLCSRMLRPLAMYGGDASSQMSSSALAMGWRQLRLLPEDRFDSQPIRGSGFLLVADLRLDNRSHLIHELGIHSPSEIADSAVLVEAWRRWGAELLEHIEGAFSFAIFNEQKQELLLARDRTGERPLFYAISESSSNDFAFASMPKGLHPAPFAGCEINEDYAIRYVTGLTIPIGQTIFRRIQRLPPGSALRVRNGKVEKWQYWRPNALPPLSLPRERDYIEALRDRLDHAVEVRLRTTGEVGAQLSGGLDSSSVTATAARLLQARGRGLTAYTAVPRTGFSADEDASGRFDNEGPAAAEVAGMYPNIRHVLVDSSAGNLLDALELNNTLYDHPCYTPNNEVWTNAIMSRARAAGVTLLLNGSSGNSTISNEGLAGLSAMFRSGKWLRLLQMGWQIRKSRSASARTIVRNALWPFLPFSLRQLTDPHIRNFSFDYSPVHPDLAHRFDLKNRALHKFFPGPSTGRPMLEHLLQYGDLSEVSMAAQAGWSMDYRDPTYDRSIIEFCLTIPLEEFLRGGRLRSLARRAMADRLPASTLARTARGRQSADWYYSMSPLRARMLAEVRELEASPLASRILDVRRMRRLVETWPDPGTDLFPGHFDDQPEIQASYHLALTRGLSMGNFLRKYDPEYRAPQAPPGGGLPRWRNSSS